MEINPVKRNYNINNKVLLFILSGTLILFSLACKKKKGSTHLVPQMERAWLWLDTGSYFIYSDSFGNTDSIYVNKLEHRFKETLESVRDESYRCTLSNGFIYYMEANQPYIILEKVGLTDYVAIVLYHYSQEKSKNVSLNSSLVTNFRDTILPNYQIENLIFDSTIVWNITHDYVLQSLSSTYYFSKGIGITQFFDHEKKIYKRLIRYKVNRISKELE